MINSPANNANGPAKLAIIRERSNDKAAVTRLMDQAFGSERNALTVYRLREHRPHVPRLAYVAIDPERRMRGSLRFFSVQPGEAVAVKSLLLGPLAIDPSFQGGGAGKALVTRGLDEAARLGWDLCFVVGEPSYYGRFGFTNASRLGFALPGWVEARRFQVKELRRGALHQARPVEGALATLAPPSDEQEAQS